MQKTGRIDDVIISQRSLKTLCIVNRYWYLTGLGSCYRAAGRYAEAISAYKQAFKVSPDGAFAHVDQAANYSLLGREEEARAEVVEVLRINPKFSLEYFAKSFPYKNQADRERLVEALHKAGLK